MVHDRHENNALHCIVDNIKYLNGVSSVHYDHSYYRSDEGEQKLMYNLSLRYDKFPNINRFLDGRHLT